jgi:3-phenylpropionate/trans-cinnamate dioxygenase ferredoxin reductase subunit
MHTARIVIVGAGHAGGAVAAFLRQYGFSGHLTLVGDEGALPYQRPPLSKGWLAGNVGMEDVELRPRAFYEENRIDLRLDRVVASMDRIEKRIRLDDGETIPYDILIIATGCCPIFPSIPGIETGGVLALRSAYDAARLKAAVSHGKTLAIVGGGYIGLEVAASARALGAHVVVVEREPRVLARVAHPIVSSFLARIHERHGVRIESARCVVRIGSTANKVDHVELDDGRTVVCDAVLIGVGGKPNDNLARAAGLDCDGGIVVDLQARTSDPDIFAIGDVTRRPMPLYDRMHRLESVPNAIEQAKQAACAITGRPAPAHEVPWQWSDQYDLRIQIAGYPFGADNVVLRGSPETEAFSLFHFSGDRLLAVEAVNSAPEFMTGRQLIGRNGNIDKRKLTDISLSMKQIVNQ